MQNILGQITLLVDDYDKALSYYTELLDFELLEDNIMSPEKRWVVIAPKASNDQGCKLLTAKKTKPVQMHGFFYPLVGVTGFEPVTSTLSR